MIGNRSNRKAKEVVCDIGFGDKGVFTLTMRNPSGFTDYTEHNVTVGGWYGLTLNLQKIPGDVMTKVSDELIPLLEQLDLSDTLAPVEIEPDWAERMLNEFGLGYFSMLDASEYIFAGFNDIVVTKYISECLTAFNVSVEYLYGLPYNVDQTGMLMDAAKVILNPFNRNGNADVQKQWQILTGFEGSYLEHTLFELWCRKQAISAVKALEIAKTEGIPLYLIDFGNIGAILPLLQVSQDVKDEIVNSVSAGKNVKISERNVQQDTWEGVGYIIRDPETGAGAYKISGGIAGGEMNYPLYGNILFVLLTLNRHRASICVGSYFTTTSEDIARNWEAVITFGQLLAMGYFPMSYIPLEKSHFRKAIADKNSVIFVYYGDGNVDKEKNVTLLNIAKSFETIISITHNDISSWLPEGHRYIFVLLWACYSARYDHQLGNSFNATCDIGNNGSPTPEGQYIREFWYECLAEKTIEQAYIEHLKYIPNAPGDSTEFLLNGDGDFRLKRW